MNVLRVLQTLLNNYNVTKTLAEHLQDKLQLSEILYGNGVTNVLC
jgi:hypothetical protein